jgi:GGDEF domain-containing protein
MAQAYYAGSSLHPPAHLPINSGREVRRCAATMRPPSTLGQRQVQVGASVGVTISDATEVDAVLREAGVAMHTAKARGKGRFELASSSA